MKLRQLSAALLALPFLLSGCGGSDESQPSAKVASVYVFGDSLQDVGTFGLKFTVNGPETQLYVERIAQTYGVDGMCNHYVPTSAGPNFTFGPNPATGCNNYAIGGGRINFTFVNNNQVVANNNTELSVQKQLADATAARTYAATDLLIVDGGGNDAADLVTNFLAAATDGGVKFGTMVASLGVTPTADPVATGAAYMTALANQYHAALKANALDKGAQRVVVINIPGILNTPRFKLVLASIAQQAGQAQADQSRALFDGWIQVFNARLATLTAGDSRIALVDLYTEFNNQVAFPAQFKLTNVETPACPITGVGGDGLPEYTFATCTSTALSADIPDGETSANWWKSYAFADGFHPTPYGHQLVSQLISRSLARAGWL